MAEITEALLLESLEAVDQRCRDLVAREAASGEGLISRERANQFSKTDSASLTFLLGLSTANAVSNVSGRGVGMDVVKTNVERL